MLLLDPSACPLLSPWPSLADLPKVLGHTIKRTLLFHLYVWVSSFLSPSFCLRLASAAYNGYSEAPAMKWWLRTEQSDLVQAWRAQWRRKSQLYCQVGSQSHVAMTDARGKHSAEAISGLRIRCTHRWGAPALFPSSGCFLPPLLLPDKVGLDWAQQGRTHPPVGPHLGMLLVTHSLSPSAAL